MDKRKITLTVIGVAILLLVLVGSTYAYWTLNGTPKTSANVRAQTGGLILRLDDVNGITSNDVIDPNNLSFSKYFSITNESASDGYAKVLFKGLTNTFVSNALVYDLEEVQANKTSYATPRMIVTNEVIPKVSNSNATLVDALLIEKGTVTNNTVTPNTKYYKVTVRYKYSDTVNQNEDLNKTLVSGFTLEQGSQILTMDVSFVTNDTSVSTPASKTVTFQSTYEELPTLSKTGYKAEWYTDSLLTEKVEDTSKVTKVKNHTLYAKWVEKKSIACVNDSGNEMDCPSTLAIGQRMKIGDQYFRYIRTTNTSDTEHTYNECQDGGDASIACTDADSRHPLANNQLRLLAEYNLNVGAIYNGSSKISDVDTTSTTYGLQDSTARGWVSSGNRVATIAYGPNTYYSQSNVKTYTENYANYLNTTYFSGSNEVRGSAITLEELKMLGCDPSNRKCSGTPNWVYTSSYWSGSPRNDTHVWGVFSDANLGDDFDYYHRNYDYGVRPVISISADSI